MPAGVSAYVALANVTLGSSTSTITFSNINQGYRDLILVQQGVSTSPQLNVRLNNDSGQNYSLVRMSGDGSSASSDTTTTSRFLVTGASGVGTNVTNILQIFDYSTTDKHKSALWRSDSASGDASAGAGRFASTAAITEINIVVTTHVAGESFALYGVSA